MNAIISSADLPRNRYTRKPEPMSIHGPVYGIYSAAEYAELEKVKKDEEEALWQLFVQAIKRARR